MSGFVDHLQLLPVPSRGGVRQPDGEHRPGGLGMPAFAERLEARGWTARVEDIGFDRRLPERRIAESYARAIADAIDSAWDRRRFPALLTRVNHGALGAVDALGPRGGVLWVSPRTGYAAPSLLRRPDAEASALAFVTGRAPRDRLAVRPVRLPADRIVVVGGERTSESERRALEADGARFVGIDGVADAVAGLRADAWYVHVDASALTGDAAPAADEPGAGGLAPEALAATIREALGHRPIRCVGLARYDLNRSGGQDTADTLVGIVEAAALAAGGDPRPAATREA
ncbi:MAG TPA: hypothetical protein VM778_11250 [Gemmatimonadota bacterium]|nr:hypothetical protein [Gemmatimonadota bacterium]